MRMRKADKMQNNDEETGQLFNKRAQACIGLKTFNFLDFFFQYSRLMASDKNTFFFFLLYYSL